jgi:hypothetical protein
MITRNPPIQIENQLRKEALYGCIICGCPVLVYVDIIQQDKEVFIPENMVALCPIHRNKYHDNDLEEDLLRNAKLSPYNKNVNSMLLQYILQTSQSMLENANS